MRCSLLFAVLLAGFASLALAPLHAADEGTDKKAYDALRARVDPPKGGDPQQAVAAYSQFIQAHQDLHPWVGAEVCARVADLRYSALKDTKLALEVADWAIKSYAAHPALVVALNAKAKILLAEKRPAEVEPLYQENWERIAAAGRAQPTATAVWYWTQALDAQGKKEKTLPLLQKAILELPCLLDESSQSGFDGIYTDWIYTRVNETLLDDARDEEAVRWAKLRFLLCKFEQARIERSAKMLASALTAKDPSQRIAKGFAEAQADPAKPNPLAEVKLPDADPDLVKAQLTRLQGPWATHDRISVLIRSGDLLQAMREARKQMLSDPNLPNGALEVCRVFKAADLNLKRANDFINYVKTGQGANPLEQFFREEQAKPRPGALFLPPNPAEMAELLAVRPQSQVGRLVQTVDGGFVLTGATPGPTRQPVLPPTVAVSAVAVGPRATETGVRPLGAQPVASAGALARLQPVAPVGGVPPLQALTPVSGLAGVVPVAAVPAGGPAPELAAIEPLSLATGLPAVTAVAIAPQRVDAAPLQAVSGASVTQALVLAQLAVGKTTPEEAWESGGLPVETVVGLLQRGSDTKTALGLAGVLVAHYPERLEAEPALNATARMALADYFASKRDQRAVDYYEGLLGEMTEKVNAKVPALEKLARYYDSVGEWRKAVDTYLRADRYSVYGRCMAANTTDAARLCLRNGDEKRALELYAKVPGYGYGWDTGIAYLDQARLLTDRGQHMEARKLLSQPVTGERAEEIRVALLSELACSYYQTGEFQAARASAEDAIARCQHLVEPRGDSGLDATLSRARRCALWAERWNTAGQLIADPPQVRARLVAADEELRAEITVRCFRAVPLRLNTFPPSGLRARFRVDWIPIDAGFCFERRIEVSIPSAARQERASVLLSSEMFPGLAVEIPVLPATEPDLSIRPVPVVLGLAKQGDVVSGRARIAAGRPFRVVSARVDTPALRVSIVEEDGGAYRVDMSFDCRGLTPGTHKGTVHVGVEGLAQTEADIPYIVYVAAPHVTERRAIPVTVAYGRRGPWAECRVCSLG